VVCASSSPWPRSRTRAYWNRSQGAWPTSSSNVIHSTILSQSYLINDRETPSTSRLQRLEERSDTTISCTPEHSFSSCQESRRQASNSNEKFPTSFTIITSVSADDKLDRFLEEGGLRCIIHLASSGCVNVKKHAGLALYALAKNGELLCLGYHGILARTTVSWK
jgi:hypothetical protein